tara:strand:+ start:612 stop:749 length:138 start_codon:yes stop_codon:yes gene_type:complete
MNVIIKGKATRIEFLNRSSVINSIEISANIINNIPAKKVINLNLE